jgi:hypothetical protein
MLSSASTVASTRRPHSAKVDRIHLLVAAPARRHQTAGTNRKFMGTKLGYTECCSAFGGENASECRRIHTEDTKVGCECE